MKKILSIILVLVICLSLSACKSKEVKNVEELINSIGEITLDSENAIIAAENAYSVLAEEDKTKVENYNALLEARDVLEELRFVETLVGTWVFPCDGSELVFNSDYTCTNSYGEICQWSSDKDTKIITIENFDVIEVVQNGDFLELWVLTDDAPMMKDFYLIDYYPLIQKDDFDTRIKKVDITMDNWQDYFAFSVQEPLWKYNEFDEVTDLHKQMNFGWINSFIGYNNSGLAFYQNIVNPYNDSEVVFEIKWIEDAKYYEADFTQKTYSIGELLETRVHYREHSETLSTTTRNGYNLPDVGVLYHTTGYNTVGHTENGEGPLFIDIFDFDVARVKGHIYIFE